MVHRPTDDDENGHDSILANDQGAIQFGDGNNSCDFFQKVENSMFIYLRCESSFVVQIGRLLQVKMRSGDFVVLKMSSIIERRLLSGRMSTQSVRSDFRERFRLSILNQSRS
jgi:hypothetical protein